MSRCNALYHFEEIAPFKEILGKKIANGKIQLKKEFFFNKLYIYDS